MKIKRIKKLKVNSYLFNLVWDSASYGGSFSYEKLNITIGVKSKIDEEIFEIICHELLEIVAVEMRTRLSRPDCGDDYIFVYDHRQHSTTANMFAGLVSQFIK
jgi:hypothetical protein